LTFCAKTILFHPNKQITKKDLKDIKLKIPTKYKKIIWENANSLYLKNKDNFKENILKYRDFWFKVLRLSKFQSEIAMSKRYKAYHDIMTILYHNDKSESFNARFTEALKARDYDKAIKIAVERPNVLMRHLVLFCRFDTDAQDVRKEKHKNYNYINQLVTKTENCNEASKIKSSAFDWIYFFFEDFLKKYKPTIKQCYQVIEELSTEKNMYDTETRVIRNNKINYDMKYPAVNENVAKFVIDELRGYIADTKRKDNENLGKIYIDDSIKN
jgi:hypothetical protein